MLTFVFALFGPLVVFELGSAAVRARGRGRARHLVPVRSRLLPTVLRNPLIRALEDADVDASPEDVLRLGAAVATAVFIVGSALAPALGVLGGLAVVLGGPVALRIGATRRTRRMIEALPSVLDEVGAELRGGGNVISALERMADGDGPLAPDLQIVRARMVLGADLGGALEVWARERPYPGFVEVAGALTVAATTGGRAAAALTGLAASLRDRLAATAEARAQSAQARVSAVVVGLAPIGYLVFSAAVDPASIATLVGSNLGRACLGIGLALDGLAAAWMRRLVGSEP